MTLSGSLSSSCDCICNCTGVIGPMGPAGPQGLPGSVGQSGSMGPQGLSGSMGLQGLQGPAGLIGQTGMQGIQGPEGIIGPAGPQGEQGIPGPAGIPGVSRYTMGFSGASVIVPDGTIKYFGICTGKASSMRAYVELEMLADCIVENLRTYVSMNQTSADSNTIEILKNGELTLLHVTYNINQVGDKADLLNKVSLSAGDKISISCVNKAPSSKLANNLVVESVFFDIIYY